MDRNTVKNLWKTLAREKLNTKRNAIEYCILKAIAAKNENKIEIAKHFLHKAFTTKKNGRPFEAIRNGSPIYSGDTVILGKKAKDFMSELEITLYQSIHENIFRDISSLTRYYSYFFTRQDIFPEYQLVQTAHAALELGNQLTSEQIKNLYFSCIGVAHLDALEEVERKLTVSGHKFVTFREPDIGNQKTAIGVYPIAEHKRGNLREYKRLCFNEETPVELQLVA